VAKYFGLETNELKRKGIDVENTVNGVGPDPLAIQKVTRQQLLEHGEKTLREMQQRQLEALEVERMTMGDEIDRILDEARSK